MGFGKMQLIVKFRLIGSHKVHDPTRFIIISVQYNNYIISLRVASANWEMVIDIDKTLIII